MSQDNLQHFPLLLQYSGGTVNASLRAEFCHHMTLLQAELKSRIFLPFYTTNLSEAAFSALVAIKTKSRNRLEVHSDIILAVTAITPDIPLLVKGMQAQGGH